MRCRWGLTLVALLWAFCAQGCAELELGGEQEAVKKPPPCKKKPKDKKEKREQCQAVVTVGSAGGTVAHPGGATLQIPPGALDADVAIAVRNDGAAGPPGVALVSPIFTFEPDGLVFARPVTVTFEVGPAVTSASVYWSRATAAGTVWDELAAAVSGGVVTSQVFHFSGGGAGASSGGRTIDAKQSVTYYQLDPPAPDGIEIVHTDFGSVPVVAVLDDGTTITGDPDAVIPGLAHIVGVPDGPVWVTTGELWIRTAGSSVDFGHDTFGTADMIPADLSQPHPLHIDITGLTPLTDQDKLEMLIADAATWYFDFPFPPDAIGDLGATEIHKDWELNLMGAHFLVDTDDVAIFAQLTAQTSSNGTAYTAMTRIATAAPFAIPQAGGTVSVALGPLATPITAAYEMHNAEFADLVHDGTRIVTAPPAGETTGWPTDASWFTVDALFQEDGSYGAFDIQGIAGDRGVGTIGATADFAFFDWPDSNARGDFDTGDLHYGVPDGDWEIFAGVLYSYLTIYRLRCPDPDPTPCSTPGGWARQMIGNAVGTGMGDSRDPSEPVIAPSIGPPFDLTIGGLPGQQPQTGVGTTPTIAWSVRTAVPLDGHPLEAPQVYDVRIFRLELDDSLGEWRTRRDLVADFRTTETEVAVPDGLLEDGKPYVVHVGAGLRAQTPGIEPIDEPFRRRNPSYGAATTSAVFRTDP